MLDYCEFCDRKNECDQDFSNFDENDECDCFESLLDYDFEDGENND